MSDRIRKSAGTALGLAALLFCLVPVLPAGHGKSVRYRSGMIAAAPAAAIDTEQGGTVRVNEADADELTGLYGVGETLAALIAEEREKNGPFYYPEDLVSVRGIGHRMLQKFRQMIDLTRTESGE